jgi:hypothetical protein
MHRYVFRRAVPDYPRPAIWRTFYVATSTGDERDPEHACVAEAREMLKGQPAASSA